MPVVHLLLFLHPSLFLSFYFLYQTLWTGPVSCARASLEVTLPLRKRLFKQFPWLGGGFFKIRNVCFYVQMCLALADIIAVCLVVCVVWPSQIRKWSKAYRIPS